MTKEFGTQTSVGLALEIPLKQSIEVQCDLKLDGMERERLAEKKGHREGRREAIGEARATISGLIADREREKLNVSRLRLDLRQCASRLHDQSIEQYNRRIQHPPRDPEYRVKYLKANTAVENFRTASRRHGRQLDQKDAIIRQLESQVAELKLSVERARFDTGKVSDLFLICLVWLTDGKIGEDLLDCNHSSFVLVNYRPAERLNIPGQAESHRGRQLGRGIPINSFGRVNPFEEPPPSYSSVVASLPLGEITRSSFEDKHARLCYHSFFLFLEPSPSQLQVNITRRGRGFRDDTERGGLRADTERRHSSPIPVREFRPLATSSPTNVPPPPSRRFEGSFFGRRPRSPTDQ
jgi:hypothetical protein